MPVKAKSYAERQAIAQEKQTSQELALLERQLAATKARDDLLTFTKFTMPDPEHPNDVSKSRYEPAPFHEAIAKHLEQLERGDFRQLILTMPPRAGKTELATKRFVAWYLGRNPLDNVAVATYSDTMAEDYGSDIRWITQTPQYKQIFPTFKLRRGGTSKSNIQTEKGGRAVFVGVGGALTGRGANCLVGGTLVETRFGQKPIEEIAPGEEVLSYDTRNGRAVWRTATAVARRPRARLLRVSTAAGRVVEATADHRFYADNSWKEAGQLTSGDRLVRAVRRDAGAPSVRDQQALPPRLRAVLLLRRLLGASGEHSASRGTGVLAMRRAGAAQSFLRHAETGAHLLLEGVPHRRAERGVRDARARAHAPVQAVQRALHAAQRWFAVLQPPLRLAGAFGSDGSREQPALARRREREAGKAPRSEEISRASADGPEAGRATLRSLRSDGEAARSSHRRERAEQSHSESHNAVPAVPYEGAFFTGESDAVAAVEDAGRDAVVYDLQVEETECFFANGILVHNCLILDDLVKGADEARSQTMRDQTWEWFTKVAMTRRMGKKLVIIIMTRWHSDDVIGRLTDPNNPKYDPDEAKEWKIINLPAIAGEDDPLGREKGAPLWPERYDMKFLEQQRRLDPLGFSALYQQQPTVADGILFRRENIRRYRPEELPTDLRFYCTSDHAVGTKQRNDRSCFGKGGVDAQDNLWLTDIFWERAPSDQAVEAMLAMARGNQKPLLWWAERGHISKSIGPFLRKRMLETGTYINLVEVTPIGDKEQRAQSIAARVALGKVFIPHGEVWDRVIEEMLGFPNAIHDDAVDMLSLFGLGLGSQFGPKAQRQRQEPARFGTLAWVKENDKWAEQRKRAASYGGF